MPKQSKNQTILPFDIEFEREEGGRWIAEIPKLPGVMVYGTTKEEATRKVFSVALRTLADKIEQGGTPLVALSDLFQYGMARR